MAERTPPALAEKYKIGRIIGEGNFSVVKECVNKTTGVRYAIKCINKTALNTKDRSNLVQEINILKELDHPNIIKLFDVYDEDPIMCYLVMEYAQGGELFDRIIAKEYYTEIEAKKVVKVVARALQFCHTRGVTHRDLKPENLLYENEKENARIKIADFGFAKLVTPETNMSTMCGTPGYYAPEIVRKQPYDNKCDIWSLGIITYILLCGFLPFYDENQVEEMRKILLAEFEFVTPYFDGVSLQAKDLIKKMLVVDPTQRPNAEQVLQHPWFHDCQDESEESIPAVLNVGINMKEVKSMSTRTKFRAGVGAIIAVQKTQKLLNIKKQLKKAATTTITTATATTATATATVPDSSIAATTATPTATGATGVVTGGPSSVIHSVTRIPSNGSKTTIFSASMENSSISSSRSHQQPPPPSPRKTPRNEIST